RDVHVGGPVFPEFRATVVALGKPNAGQIAGERVVPYVENLLGITRPGDAPFDLPAAYGDVAQSAPDKAHHFVAAEIRLHELRVFFIMFEQSVRKSRKLEKVVFL